MILVKHVARLMKLDPVSCKHRLKLVRDHVNLVLKVLDMDQTSPKFAVKSLAPRPRHAWGMEKVEFVSSTFTDIGQAQPSGKWKQMGFELIKSTKRLFRTIKVENISPS